MVSSFPDNVQKCLFQMNGQQNTVLVASSVCVDGIKYAPHMIVSVGSCAGLPDFRQITKLVVINIQLTCDFTLQYEDPAFNNALCNLSDMSDLPSKATLKVIPHASVITPDTAIDMSNTAESTPSTSDTQILSSDSSNSSSKHQWPKIFEIPFLLMSTIDCNKETYFI
ncbi:Translation initiation factor IF-2 [Labeo rohita]|uniref:Translation initiation factor IF-2 n=1 Tax=Labeo rohita TaxID=84645 RepID=A0ABQ8L8B9_LABRO|nr:Translation initiation factor IF-2 [Labeo rohita]